MVPLVQVQEVRTIEQAESVAHEWEELWEQSADPTPFQAPRWLSPWWRHIGSGELLIVLIRCDGVLVGLMPLFICHEAHSNTRKLMLLGTGTSDYLDGLFARDHEHAVLDRAFDYLRGKRDEWDVIDLQQLRPESPLARHEWGGGVEELRPGESCPVLGLPKEAEQLRAVIPTHQWERLQYYMRRAERMGVVEFVPANSDNFDEVFETFVNLHMMRLAVHNRPTSIQDRQVQQFHREAASRLLKNGMLRLMVMQIDRNPVAAFYGFKVRERTFFYLSGFDPAWAQISPGMLVVGQAIREAVLEGCTRFDFLRGEEPYKYKWGALNTPTYERILSPMPLKGAFERQSHPVDVMPGV